MEVTEKQLELLNNLKGYLTKEQYEVAKQEKIFCSYVIKYALEKQEYYNRVRKSSRPKTEAQKRAIRKMQGVFR